jgi:DNA-binding CsgD family transcriptional regulator
MSLSLEFYDRIGDATSLPDVLNLCGEHFDAYGAVIRSYHIAGDYASQVGPDAVIIASGYPPTWIKRYLDPACRINDPIPDFVMQSGKTMTWRRALASQTLTPPQQDFAQQMREAGLDDGIGSPLFGPRGYEAYLAFSFGRPMTREDKPIVRLLINTAQAAHRRAIALNAADRTPPKLSKREQEVLHWIVRGKSARDIATIIDRQPATVETYVKRLYGKLEVHDRAAAIVEALRYGLVKL